MSAGDATFVTINWNVDRDVNLLYRNTRGDDQDKSQMGNCWRGQAWFESWMLMTWAQTCSGNSLEPIFLKYLTYKKMKDNVDN